MKKPILILILAFLALFPGLAQKVDMSLMHALAPRNIGPAGMSGRVTAIDVVHRDPSIMYVGTASGGLWKSTGGGVAWEPIFDKEKVASIGAISIFQKNPDIIWVGTGEGNPRNSQNMGGGVYLSRDGGNTWELKGLENTRVIHNIWVHPDDHNTVLVGAMGDAWADSEHRGLYKTTDGGKTWRKTLHINEKTGIGAMAVDPSNPNKIFAATWEFRRWPWFFKSGGAGSGLYVSHDGGETWKKRTSEDGLPEGELGRIGLAIAPSNPKIVYALVESKKNAFYKSTDGGVKWTKVQDKQVGDRPFYYYDLAVDPENENRVYNIYSMVYVSTDGARTFEQLLGWNPQRVHGDYHAWWIHPKDGAFMINGNDGGIAITRDRGVTWRFAENIPVGQFYHVNTDNAVPYNILGGMQDNGTWRGPSNSLRDGGLRNSYWDEISFGDGFDALADPDDNRYGYGMWQGGNLQRLDFETGHNQYIKPTHPDGIFLRFNWNAAIAQDPFSNSTIYYGSQFVHKSTDKGLTWSIISPDLTTNDPEKQKQMETGGLTFDVTGAENHTTILVIEPSPKEQGVLWVGTDDGKVQLTRDGGKTWKDVTPNAKIMPANSWIPQVKASVHNAGEAYVVANNYRRGDWTPYLYRTRDYGATWQRIIDGNAANGYMLSFVQDPFEPKLLFAGTEFGLYVSFDGAATWNKWTEGYPAATSTYDMVIQPREHDLVIATFGRSLWIIDDIRSLREIAAKGIASTLGNSISAYPVQDAYLFEKKQAAGIRFQADAVYQGADKPDGAVLTFSVKATPKQDKELKSDTVFVQIIDDKGEVIRNIYKKVEKPGLNRITWRLDMKGTRFPGSPKPKPGSPEPSGRSVLPGSYTVKYTYNGQEATSKINVLADPRIKVASWQFEAYVAKYDRLAGTMAKLTQVMDQLDEAKATVERINGIVGESELENKADLKKSNEEMLTKLKTLKEAIRGKEEVQGIFRDPLLPSSLLFGAMGYLGLYNTPNANQDTAIAQAVAAVNDQLKLVNGFFDEDWKTFEKNISNIKLTLVKTYKPID